MKFLCLHGRGTNSDIFESQLVNLRSCLSSAHIFDFIDAQFDCPPAPGIGDFYPPPYLCWHERYEPKDVQAVHDYINSVIEEDGPYDGIIGFSEGAALAASLLLCEEYTRSGGAAASIKVAIFLNGVVALSPSEKIGYNIGEAIMADQDRYIGLLHGFESEDVDKSNDEKRFSHIYGFSPDDFPCRISIPTLHVIGEGDSFAKHARAIADLCQQEKAEVFLHDGGHELPRSEATIRRCADVFERVVTMASLDGI
ncbi:EF-hand calcium-binding domain protein [Talaromyces stipitatus ATCC 10500]|uniref:EF-hand calcium-binding domain protein n=1 Tax=Talaromyces stipitatus (strain ATCC 10500 / CBS 375.48 / QM 6759 / NRRL 1006) TaxID=441959 RepID=B8MLL2_TALSN|nr:EF-hand calcium-binding domain protein [Talaromyces stipitatus ATCC 10500]EED15545.1 EF-hand calcium-binding domain protein [Talaromyces stipitatus ATCC 10500]